MSLANPPAQRQPQPRAHAGRFGRKEGLKDAPMERWRYTLAGVRHRERDAGQRGVILRREGDLARTGGGAERLLGIAQEIEQHLLQLVWITPKGWELVVKVQMHRHVVDPEGIGQQLHRLSHQRIEHYHGTLWWVLAG